MIDHLLYENKSIKDHNLNPSRSYGNYSVCAWPPQYSSNDYFDLTISLKVTEDVVILRIYCISELW